MNGLANTASEIWRDLRRPVLLLKRAKSSVVGSAVALWLFFCVRAENCLSASQQNLSFHHVEHIYTPGSCSVADLS